MDLAAMGPAAVLPLHSAAAELLQCLAAVREAADSPERAAGVVDSEDPVGDAVDSAGRVEEELAEWAVEVRWVEPASHPSAMRGATAACRSTATRPSR
jgi:hypothetical protein